MLVQVLVALSSGAPPLLLLALPPLPGGLGEGGGAGQHRRLPGHPGQHHLGKGRWRGAEGGGQRCKEKLALMKTLDPNVYCLVD